jgi:Ala-tRNA(Pro) deacylase
MSPSDRLLAFLADSGRPHTRIDHPPATSAVEAASARGTPLSIGGKSLVMRADKLGFVVLVVGSDRRIDGRLLRRALRVQRYRFATPEELAALTGLAPGEVPPFGRPLFDAALYVGEDVAARPELAFAAASRTRSVRMATADWLALAAPAVVPAFTVPDLDIP